MNRSSGPAAETPHRFDFIVVTPPGLADPGLAIAASRAGALGVLDLQFVGDGERARSAVHALARHARGRCGIKLDSGRSPQYDRVLAELPERISLAILSPTDPHHVLDSVGLLHGRHLEVLLEVVTDDEARAGEQAGVDGLIAKGHESGGRVGDETTFVLLQRLLATTTLPVWAQGGIGLHTGAASFAAGAAGVVLDSQLVLTRESGLAPAIKDAVARLDGSETVCVGRELGACIRVVAPPRSTALAELQRFVQLHEGRPVGGDTLREWWRQVGARIGWDAPERQLWPLGQDVAPGAPSARRFDRVARVLDDFREAAVAGVRVASALKPLDAGAPLARAHGTRYPIVQGPMTRVSDNAEFAARVSEGGALPFLALALMRAPDVARLLDQTRAALGERPWGVGILGFVPEDLRAEQLEVVRAARPSAALIAGGHPHQAVALERAGIPTYLHVPSPGLLKLFIETGARRFVFEGRECGGHVGPRGSFALWNAAVETMLTELPPTDLSACHVLFAGGIHDARSASMVAALAAPLAERGAKIGVLLGTAYLFTHEAVASGAIVEGFQREALSCRRTVLLSSGPGHLTRCAATPYAEQFERERRRLIDAGQSSDDVRSSLEALNLGRLRLAAKGLKRADHDDPAASRLVVTTEVEQHAHGMYMIGQLAALENSTRSIADLHHDVSRASSSRLDHVTTDPPVRTGDRDAPRPFDIAIVGMSCLLPKAPDVWTYWDNIIHKVDAITEVPSDRWDWRKYYDPDRGAADKVNSKWGGFLEPIRFDPARYGMPPNSLASIEPLQLLTLEAVRAALADAGMRDGDLPRERTAVILGVSGGIADLGQQYAVRSALPTLLDPVPPSWLAKLAIWSEDSFPGILPNVAAGRVANRYDLGGVNYTVDAACASSLAAVHLASRELEAGTSDVVIVGGADTIQNPFAYLCFAKTHALSPRGRCATFDQSADGIAISEGVAILILKRLADAERDGDRVYAVIKGVAGSSDGRDKGLTAPRPEGQVLALQRAYEKAGVSPATVGLVEAHGTGTVAGDQAELETLNRVFGDAGAAPESCAIGSVKSMIGHTKSTAGVAGLMKVALALHHKVLPPTIHVSTPNPGARRSGSALYVNSEARPWLQADTTAPRRGSVSAFGFGGTNFHAVLEEYTAGYRETDREASSRCWPSELMVWRGESRLDIEAALTRLDAALARGSRPQLRDLSYSAWQAARNRAGLTLAMVVDSLDDLREKVKWSATALKNAVVPAELAARRISFTDRPLGESRTAFLFPGQGSQYPGMLNELAIGFGQVREPFERATRVLAGRLPRPLASYVFPPPRFRADDRQADMDALTATTVAQPALGAASLALYRLLGDCGVRPDMVAGHSYGEYAALCVAGAFDEDTLYVLSEARGRCIAESSASEPGAMAGVAADRDRTAAVIRAIDGVWIANLNGPSQTVISGRREAVDAAIVRLEQAGIGSRRLPVACAFHSPLMAPAHEQLTRVIQSTIIAAPRLPVFSNVSAQAYPSDGAAITELLAEQLVSPVRFAEQIQAMYGAGARVFVEVGPAQVLSGLVNQILDSAPHIAVPLDLRERSGLLQLQHALGQLAAHGVPVSLEPLFAGRAARVIDLDTLVVDDHDTASSTTWLVSGGHAAPLQSTSAVCALQTSESPITATQPAAGYHSNGADPLPAALPAYPGPPSVLEASGEASRAVIQFQQLMSSFLETQKQVMLAYLTGQSAGGTFEVPRIPDIRDEERPAAILSSPSAASVSSVVSPPQAASPPISRPVEDGDLTSLLMSIVSDRTGYPTELLGLDLDVEADLGIDSIKRVEIVGEFGRRLQGGHGVELSHVMAELTSAKTLRAIADRAGAVVAAGAMSANAASNPSTIDRPGRACASEPRDVPRFLMEKRDAPLPALDNRVGPADLVVITDDGRGVAERVATALRARGASVALLGPPGPGRAEDAGAQNRLDVRAVSDALDSARARFGRRVSGVLHLLPLRHAAGRAAIEAQPDAEEEVQILLSLVRGAAEDLKAAGASDRGWVIAATAMGGAFGMESGDTDWVFGHGAIAGFIKTLAVEWPGVRSKVVDLETDQPSRSADRIVAEILCESDFVEVGFRGSRRITVRPVPDSLDPDHGSGLAMDPGSVLLVTGGARGITAAIATDVARRYQPRLVIVARTSELSGDEPSHLAGLASEHELKAALLAEARRTGQPISASAIEKGYTLVARQREVRSNLDAMRRAGARVDYRQVDVTDDRAFGTVIDDIYRTHGRIDGVIHGAGVIEDARLENKTPDSFARVFDTKVRSALTVVRHVRPESLRFLALFSSVAGRFGNPGQIDYSAANDNLNKLALHLDRRWPGRIVSLNWGPWAANGMASAAVRQRFIDRGITPIEVDAGCLAFDRELRCGRKGHVEVVLGDGRWGTPSIPVSARTLDRVERSSV
jgi:malonyl CoA-acyl carrier protein transacylase